MTLLQAPATSTASTGGSRTETVAVGDSLWRIVRVGGELLGYIDRLATPEGDRFRVRRMLATQRRFVAVGEFWRFDDAMGCFRF